MSAKNGWVTEPEKLEALVTEFLFKKKLTKEEQRMHPWDLFRRGITSKDYEGL